MAADELDPNDPDERRLTQLEERLKEARGHGKEPPKGDRTDASLGVAFKLGFEIIGAVVAGAGLGWALDRWLGTTPLFMIVFFFLGAGAGFYNVIRSANRMK